MSTNMTTEEWRLTERFNMMQLHLLDMSSKVPNELIPGAGAAAQTVTVTTPGGGDGVHTSYIQQTEQVLTFILQRAGLTTSCCWTDDSC